MVTINKKKTNEEIKRSILELEDHIIDCQNKIRNLKSELKPKRELWDIWEVEKGLWSLQCEKGRLAFSSFAEAEKYKNGTIEIQKKYNN